MTYSPLPRYSHQRFQPPYKKTGRVVSKSGLLNIEKCRQKFHVLPDVVTAFIKARWRWTLLYCFLTYILTWLAFAQVWWLILYTHGDLEPDHLPDAINATQWTPCIKNIYSFTSTFLFSIEIHTTIGYGTRTITLECPTAMFVMCIESILGTITQSFIVGILFAKLTRPKSRAQTVLFSKNALISLRDRTLCLVFRVGNIRKSRLIAVNMQAYLIRYHNGITNVLNDEQIKLELFVDACDDIVFMFPLSVVHKIDQSSPLYYLSAEELLRSNVEILVVLEGVIESTGQPVQVRSSFTSREILWGHRFVNQVKYRNDRHGYEIDYSKFDDTIRISTPLCSAQQLEEFYESRIRVRNTRNLPVKSLQDVLS